MIKRLKKEEIKLAIDLGNQIYPAEFHESLESFENKFSFFPDGFLGYFVNQEMIGYCIGHPWRGEDLVPLDYRGTFPKGSDCFYLHDVAVHPDYRRQGFGKELVDTLLEVGGGEGFEKFMLVAINDASRKMCEKIGFRVCEKVLYGENPAYRMKLVLKTNRY